MFYTLLPTERVAGIRLSLLVSARENGHARERIIAAVNLLESSAPVFYRRVKRYISRIVVWSGPYSAAVRPHTVQLSTSHMHPVDSLELASVLVHEATHLKIGAFKIPYRENLRRRIEELCVKEQCNFLRIAGGDGPAIAEILEDRLARPWWTDEAHGASVKRATSQE